MTRSNLFKARITALVALLAVGLAGAAQATDQSKPNEQHQGLSAAYDHVADYAYEQKRDLIAWLNARSAGLDKTMAEVDQAVDRGADQAQEEWQELSRILSEQREAAARKAETLTEAGAETWEVAKQDALRALRSFEEALTGAAEEASTAGGGQPAKGASSSN